MPLVLSGSTGITSDNITSLAASKLTGQVADANIAAVAASKLTGQVADGNAPSGCVIQVVQNTETGIVSFQNSNGTFIICNITPSFSSSKVLVSGHFIWSGDNPNGYFALERSINGGSWTGLAHLAAYDEVAATGNAWSAPVNYLDSPNTTLPITYRIYWYHTLQNGGTMHMNRSSSNDGNTFNTSGRTGRTVLITQEIAG